MSLAAQLHSQGRTPGQVFAALVSAGTNPEYAVVQVRDLPWPREHRAEVAELVEVAERESRGLGGEGWDGSEGGEGLGAVTGLLWLVGGLAVTAVTYSAAAPGGSYVLAWGPIVYGLIKLARAAAA